jgi:hypothetical protein
LLFLLHRENRDFSILMKDIILCYCNALFGCDAPLDQVGGTCTTHMPASIG